MKAIVLAAGEASHFYPLTVHRPKGMTIVAGKPLLQHTVEALTAAGVKEISFVIGSKTESLRAFFGSGANFGVDVRYVPQERPDGTGAAVRRALEDQRPGSETLVVFGDNRYEPDIFRRVLSVKGDVVMATSAANPARQGCMVARAGRLVDYEFPAKSARGLVNTGAMKFTPGFFDHLLDASPAEAAQLPDALRSYVSAGRAVQVLTTESGWEGMETVWDLLRLNEHMLAGFEPPKVQPLPGVTVDGPVVIGSKVRIAPGARLLGPLHIGNDCEIRENAVIGPNVSLRNNVHVGSHTEIRNSIVNNNVFVDSQCVVRFSILDDGTRIGAFGVIAEGETESPVSDAPALVGSVIGPDSRLGNRVTVRPGSIVGQECVVSDHALVGSLAAFSKVG